MSEATKGKKVKKKERWLLTRKTWKYMTDAGRKLIPDHLSGGHKNEDVPKIEEYFQEMCDKEPKFLLWRKNSYPTSAQKKHLKKCGGSVRILSRNNWDKSNSIYVSGGRFDFNKAKNENVMLKNRQDLITEYLKIRHSSSEEDFELAEKLEIYLHSLRQYSCFTSGDDQSCLIETLNRYFGKSSNRQKIISDLLTDRRLLEHLYFNLRKSRNFQSRYKNGQWLRSRSQENIYHVSKTEVQNDKLANKSTQTDQITCLDLVILQKEYNKSVLNGHRTDRKTSHLENDDVSQSVSETIRRYLKMARKRSVDNEKAKNRFKTVNYDHGLRDIHGRLINRESQTNSDWILHIPVTNFSSNDFNNSDSEISTMSYDSVPFFQKSHSTPSSPPNSSIGNFLQKLNPYSNSKSGYFNEQDTVQMKKSKSSSNIIFSPVSNAIQNKTLARKFFRNRSKSQTRIPVIQSFWIPQSSCVWYNGITGKSVQLKNKNLTQLNDIERKTLQKIALAKLQSLNLNVPIKIPNDECNMKSKKKSYLIKKIITNDLEKDSNGLVFGVSLNQCIENDKIMKSTKVDLLIPEKNLHKEDVVGVSVDDKNDFRESSSTLKSENSSLSNAISPNENIEVPFLLSTCIKHLKTYGLHTVGIFRVSSSKKRVKNLRETFDTGQNIEWLNDQSPHDIATLLKEYLRDLPDSLLTKDLYPIFLQTEKDKNKKQQIEIIQNLVQILPPLNTRALWMLMSFLVEVVQNAEDKLSETGEIIVGNKMDSFNLAAVFAPNILHCHKNDQVNVGPRKADEQKLAINIIQTMIDNYDKIFEISADLLDEIYLEMMETNPQVLNELLRESDFNKSQSSSLYSIDNSPQHIDSPTSTEIWKIPKKRSPDELIGGSGISSILTKIKEVGKDFNTFSKNRSASIDGSTKLNNEQLFRTYFENKNQRAVQKSSFEIENEVIPKLDSKEIEKLKNSLTLHTQIKTKQDNDVFLTSREYNASISSIGNDVMKSRTSDFENISGNSKSFQRETDSNFTSTITSSPKIYNRRKYTDSRHPTTLIPEIEKDNNEKPVTNLFKRQEIIASSRNKY